MSIHGRFSADETELCNAIKRAVQAIGQGLPEDRSDFPRDSWDALAGTGLFGLPFTADEGGLGLRLTGVMGVFETLGAAMPDNGLTFSACTHLCALAMPLARFGQPQTCARLLPDVIEGQLIGAHAISEPDVGSAAFEMKTHARQTAGGWLLKGEKCYVSNSPFADLVVVYARSAENVRPLSGFSAFLVPTDAAGVTVTASTPKIGLKTSQFGALHFDDVFVPDDMVLGQPGRGYAILDNVMKHEVLITFVAHLGQMQRRFDDTRGYVRGRRQGRTRLSAHQAVSHRLVDDFIKLETARMWLYRAANALEQGQSGAREVAIAKLLTAEANLDLAVDAIRLRGAAGYLAEAGLDTELTDAIGGVIYSGSSEIQRNRIAATLGL